MARSIFLSYRRDDTGGHTGRLYDKLVHQLGEERVFLDIDNVPIGVDFVDAIDQTLDECLVVVVMIGPRWLATPSADGSRRIDNVGDFHRLEIERALVRDLRIVPVLVGGASMPQQSELPISIRPLARRNAFELTDRRFGLDAAKLVEVLQSALLEEERRQAIAEREANERQAQTLALEEAALRRKQEEAELEAIAERDREAKALALRDAASRREWEETELQARAERQLKVREAQAQALAVEEAALRRKQEEVEMEAIAERDREAKALALRDAASRREREATELQERAERELKKSEAQAKTLASLEASLHRKREQAELQATETRKPNDREARVLPVTGASLHAGLEVGPLRANAEQDLKEYEAQALVLRDVSAPVRLDQSIAGTATSLVSIVRYVCSLAYFGLGTPDRITMRFFAVHLIFLLVMLVSFSALSAFIEW